VSHLASIPEVAESVVTLDGGSKSYGLANMRVGWACGPAPVIDAMNFFGTATTVTVPQVVKWMAYAALTAPSEYVRENARECQRRANLICNLARTCQREITRQVDCDGDPPLIDILHRPQAGHSLLVSFNGLRRCRSYDGHPIVDSADLVSHFLRQARVAFSPGYTSGFDDCTVRLTYGCVGLDTTYGDNRTEVLTVLAEAARFLLPAARAELETAIFQIGRQAQDQPTAEETFTAGRKLIEDALLDRVVPAAADLLTRRPRLARSPLPSSA
jgi:aspartate aminotransferase